MCRYAGFASRASTELGMRRLTLARNSSRASSLGSWGAGASHEIEATSCERSVCRICYEDVRASPAHSKILRCGVCVGGVRSERQPALRLTSGGDVGAAARAEA